MPKLSFLIFLTLAIGLIKQSNTLSRCDFSLWRNFSLVLTKVFLSGDHITEGIVTSMLEVKFLLPSVHENNSLGLLHAHSLSVCLFLCVCASVVCVSFLLYLSFYLCCARYVFCLLFYIYNHLFILFFLFLQIQ